MIAVNTGYEIQIDDMAAPDGNPLHKIGAIYNFASPSDAAVSKPIGQWNTFEIVPSIKQLVFQTSDTHYSFRYLPMGSFDVRSKQSTSIERRSPTRHGLLSFAGRLDTDIQITGSCRISNYLI